jgi:hypothetical protein
MCAQGLSLYLGCVSVLYVPFHKVCYPLTSGMYY